MTDEELIKQWDEYVESMGSVMGEVEHMAQQMRDRIEALVKELNISRMASVVMDNTVEELEAKLAKVVEERKAMAMRDAGYDVYAGLEAKLAKVVKERDEAQAGNHAANEYEPTWAEAVDIWKVNSQRLEAKLAKAVEEMQWALPILKKYLQHPNDIWALDDFRAVLAELEKTE